ncbi:MAG: DNA repair exonuclease [Rhodobacteraceae bacterium]|nr:DNA repair exonuclease [Paracoccaceae bacterium]
MPFRFVHTADIHLDSPLTSLALRNERLAELVGNATRQSFSRIIDLCIEEDVDALLIAGDLYDGDQTSMHTARWFAQEMDRLHRAGKATFIIRGNHDAASRITRQLKLPPSVRVFGPTAETEAFESADGLQVAVHGISFAEPHSPASLLGEFGPPVPDAFNVGMLHTSLGGSTGHDPYSPCSVQDLENAGYDYWALGHIHRREVHAGNTTIVMPGIPQGRDIGERGRKSVTLATVADGRRVELEERATALVQFELERVDAAGIEDWNDLIGEVSSVIELAAKRRASMELVLRLQLVGATELHWQIQRDIDVLASEATRAGEDAGSIWIDKVENQTRRPDDRSQPEGPVAEIERLLNEDAELRHTILEEAKSYVTKFSAALPPEAREVLGKNAETRHANSTEYMKQGIADVLATLQSQNPEGDE